jgi:hypothetical protein
MCIDWPQCIKQIYNVCEAYFIGLLFGIKLSWLVITYFSLLFFYIWYLYSLNKMHLNCRLLLLRKLLYKLDASRELQNAAFQMKYLFFRAVDKHG